MDKKQWALLVALCLVVLVGYLVGEEQLLAVFTQQSLAPSWDHPFGTDTLGRDVLWRTLKGLSTSVTLAVATSIVSGLLALVVGIVAAVGPKAVDSTLRFCVDLVMSIPHLVLLILISYALGRGSFGVLVGLSVTHFATLSRVIRSEALSVQGLPYVQCARKFGKSMGYIAWHHVLPHVWPQALVGMVLMVPHVILHEAAITFLGFGLSPEAPSIGVMLSEGLQPLLTGMWWVALPGVCLVLVVLAIDCVGTALNRKERLC